MSAAAPSQTSRAGTAPRRRRRRRSRRSASSRTRRSGRGARRPRPRLLRRGPRNPWPTGRSGRRRQRPGYRNAKDFEGRTESDWRKKAGDVKARLAAAEGSVRRSTRRSAGSRTTSMRGATGTTGTGSSSPRSDQARADLDKAETRRGRGEDPARRTSRTRRGNRAPLPAGSAEPARTRSREDPGKRNLSRESKSVFVETWGCQMNVLDGRRFVGLLSRDGYRRSGSAGDRRPRSS